MKPLMLVLSVYILTLLITSSSLFEGLRASVKRAFPRLAIAGHPHMIDCRLCTGFWVSAAACIVSGDWNLVLPVYAASYFMATQERR